MLPTRFGHSTSKAKRSMQSIRMGWTEKFVHLIAIANKNGKTKHAIINQIILLTLLTVFSDVSFFCICCYVNVCGRNSLDLQWLVASPSRRKAVAGSQQCRGSFSAKIINQINKQSFAYDYNTESVCVCVRLCVCVCIDLNYLTGRTSANAAYE